MSLMNLIQILLNALLEFLLVIFLKVGYSFLLERINKTAPKIAIESFFTTREDLVHALATNELNFAIDPVILDPKMCFQKSL